jgi:hypothetical protein
VQVHPDKTEAWVALGADPEASILACQIQISCH